MDLGKAKANADAERSNHLTTSDLIFSSQANHNFSRILGDLKRFNLSIPNRLRSIREDAGFVAEVAEAFGRPLVANERCGSWYIPPAGKAGSAYFKSTDGHAGQWKFSTRRLNLHLLEIIGRGDGCIVVDSTRRGKRMPDALSKTVPIWCCVLNHVFFPTAAGGDGDGDAEKLRLFTPPHAVSASEHAQMEARVPGFVDSFAALALDLEPFRRHLRKPLRPMWVTQESQLHETDVVFENYHPVICCTSSRRVVGTEMSEAGYIQGAGDDTENWALGLTAPLFWAHEARLLATPEADLPELIASLVAAPPAGSATYVQLTPHLWVGALSQELSSPDSTCATIALPPRTTDPSTWVKSRTYMEAGIGKHKLASRNLRTALPQISDFVQEFLQSSRDAASEGSQPGSPRVLVLCENGKDISVGVALSLLCQFFDEDGSIASTAHARDVNKNIIKIKLSRIMTAFAEANPSRATLQSVNSFLMG